MTGARDILRLWSEVGLPLSRELESLEAQHSRYLDRVKLAAYKHAGPIGLLPTDPMWAEVLSAAQIIQYGLLESLYALYEVPTMLQSLFEPGREREDLLTCQEIKHICHMAELVVPEIRRGMELAADLVSLAQGRALSPKLDTTRPYIVN